MPSSCCGETGEGEKRARAGAEAQLGVTGRPVNSWGWLKDMPGLLPPPEGLQGPSLHISRSGQNRVEQETVKGKK